MPRLHTLYLPNGRRSTPFAFILDQTNPMTDDAITAWKGFAVNCGALDIMFTAETIDIDPETSDGWQPDDDEPIDLYTTDHSDCHHSAPSGVMRVLIDTLVQAGNAEAWVPWEPANLDPESPKVMTHREEACPALTGSVLGCPMHEVFVGPWAAWPYYASRTAEEGGVVTRICDHGITHPTPEEYVGGFDAPHLCDGCPCAAPEDRDLYAIVVSDLANTRLPRGTLLLGAKDDPRQAASRIAPEWADHLAKQPRDASGKFIDDPTPVTTPPASPSEWARDLVDKGTITREQATEKLPNLYDALTVPAPDLTAENWGQQVHLPLGPTDPSLYPTVDLQDVSDAEPGSVRRGGVAFPVRVQPLGPDGEPVGEAWTYPLAGPVGITEKEYGDPVLSEEAFEPFGSSRSVRRRSAPTRFGCVWPRATVRGAPASTATTVCTSSARSTGSNLWG
jgi:hypothetical protein